VLLTHYYHYFQRSSHRSPVVLIMLLGVAVAAAKMFGVLPGVAAPPVVGVPTVLTDRLPGGAFLTGTTTLLSGDSHTHTHMGVDQSARPKSWNVCDPCLVL